MCTKRKVNVYNEDKKMTQILEKTDVAEYIIEMQRRANLYIEALDSLVDKYTAYERIKQEVIEARKNCKLLHGSYYETLEPTIDKCKPQVEDDMIDDIGMAILKRENEILTAMYEEL